MAFGFIKKIFSFGKKEVVEEQAAAAGVETELAPDSAGYAAAVAAEAAELESIVATEDISKSEMTSEIPPIADGDAAGADSPPDGSSDRHELESEESTTDISVSELLPDVSVAASTPSPADMASVEATTPELPSLRAYSAEDISSAGISADDSATVVGAAPIPETTAPRREGRIAVGEAIEAVAAPRPEPLPEPKKRWFQRLREGLSRSSKELTASVAGVFTKRRLDEETLEELEEVLIRADLGAETAIRISGALSEGRYGKNISNQEIRDVMAREIEKTLGPVAQPLELDLSHKPHVILVVGVNGTGKTTTIGKLAAKLRAGGLDVMLAAGDTFRAAAIEQLHIWGERTGSTVISNKLGADAASLAYDAYEKAREAGADVLIVDTAGRLQNRAELMAELEKIVRVLGKLDPDAPHTVLQTLDATTGQNALNQVEIFRNVAGVNGLVMTKLDGTARGGILVAIAAKHRLPVYFIGVGEGVDDLEPFAAKDFADAIAGVNA